MAAAALLVGGADYWLSRLQEPVGPPQPVGPMVQLLGNGGFAVVWELPGPGPADLQLVEPDGDLSQVPMLFENGHHVARLEGLRPGTEYVYEVSGPQPAGGRRVAYTGAVRPPPDGCRSFRFEALGDSGGGGGPQWRIEWCMRQYDPDLIIHTGDLVYDVGAKHAFPSRFFRPYEPLIARVPFCPVLGNHDLMTDDGGPWLQTFLLPENGPDGIRAERCYWFDYCDARFVAIDTNLDEATLAGEVVPWLQQVLAAAEATWKFVYFHHPVYTSSRHAPSRKVLAYLVPVFEEVGVDVAFAGHNHLYERSQPLRGGRVVPPGEGVVYVTTGAGGSTIYAERLPAPDYIAAYYDEDFSFTLVDIEETTLRLRQVNSDNELIDEWSYEKGPARPGGLASPAPSASSAQKRPRAPLRNGHAWADSG